MLKQFLKAYPTNAAGLREINNHVDPSNKKGKYKNSRMYDWLNGKYRIPQEVCDFIRGRILYAVLREYRVINESNINEINDRLRG